MRLFLKKQKPDEVILLLNFDDIDRMVIKNLFVLHDDSLFATKRYEPNSWYYRINAKWWHEWFERTIRFYSPLSSWMWKELFFYDDFEYVNSKHSPLILYLKI